MRVNSTEDSCPDDSSVWVDELVARARSEGAHAAAAFLLAEKRTLMRLRNEGLDGQPPPATSPFIYTLR